MAFSLRHKSQIQKQSLQPWDSLETPHGSAIDMIYKGRGVGAALFSNAAAFQDGATTEWIARNQGVVVSGDREVIVDGSVLNESSLGAAICNDKALTKKFLLAMGVRTPRGRIVRSPTDAAIAAEEILGAVVVKPVGGGMGSGVTVGAQGGQELREAYRLAAGPAGRRVLVEECIETESEYRCMATNDECVSVIERTLPAVVGDGASTIRELVRTKNEERALNPGIHNLPIPIDYAVDIVLRRQNLTLDSIPVGGERVLVRNIGGLSGGGEPIDRFDQVSSEVRVLAHQAIQAIPSLSWGGVDVVIERNTGVPFVLEINTQAGYGAATFPVRGKARDVASVAWRDRRSMVKRDSPKCSCTLRLRSEPLTIGPSREEAPSGLTFADYFFAWLSAQGCEVDREHERVVKVSEHGDEMWFRSNAASGSDLLAAHRIVRRHNLVRLLLARKRVPRVRGRLMQEISEFDRFFGKGEGQFVGVRRASHWGGPRSVVVESDEVNRLFNNRNAWVVQSYPARNRMSVFATRTRALAVLQGSDEPAAAASSIEAACSVAVDAVRAIPELRWATVDVVEGAIRGIREERPQVFVEGVNINKSFTGKYVVRAGDIEMVYRFVFNG